MAHWRRTPEIQVMNQIMYQFCRKSIANPWKKIARSGIPEGTKEETMSSELKNRWKNTLKGAAKETFENIIIEFMYGLAP